MQQLTQQLKSGHMEILEVPFPVAGKGMVLVRNHYSVISAGTEGKTVTDARKGYLAKARSRQKEVRQVIDLVRTQGLRSTYDLVMNKLEAPSPLGYSCAGEVIAVGEGVTDLRPGDRVACGGQGAYHADVVAVYRNLCTRVPDGVDLRHAAFTTIAAIAIQGIRQAELQAGSNCVVIGLGLIGQLTIRLLRAAGITPVGIDIDDQAISLSHRAGFEQVFQRSQAGLEKHIAEITRGLGTDAVIITAGTSSTDPVELSGILCRRKGKVVIVGAVPTGFSREHYYKKELDLRMSSSYGPGRYDPDYEEAGRDYPAGYVRWTENRNMQAFLDLLAAKSLDMESLITHQFSLPEAPEAYTLILEKTEHFAGILISYDVTRELKSRIALQNKELSPSGPVVGLIGAGNFTQNMLLPRMRGLCTLAGIATAQGNESVYVGKKYGFAWCTDKAEEILADPAINTVFITTRHNLHAGFVMSALEAGKNVYVEKPLAMNRGELEAIRETYQAATAHAPLRLMVGYNRRFSPHVEQVRKLLIPGQAKSIHIRINAGSVPKGHWVQQPEVGGGRIIGEVCHFIDLAMYLAGAPIRSVSAVSMADPDGLRDTVAITLGFGNGSIASLSYFSNGHKDLPKERIEIFCGGTVAILDDFRVMEILGDKSSRSRLKGQDKGHARQLQAFLGCIKTGSPSPIPFDELYLGMLATFAVHESISTGRVIDMTDMQSV